MITIVVSKTNFMENVASNEKSYSLGFSGHGEDYFGIMILNWLLNILTLGLYYPWAKEKQLKFIYGHLSLNQDRFSFHGTGKEMFIGFLKAIAIFAIIYGAFFALILNQWVITAMLVIYLGIFSVIPLAIHGSYRYRMSRTSWRGIRFGYRGSLKELYIKFISGLLLTLVTLGIYGAWFSINLRNYVLSHIRFGDLQFKYKGDGGQFFILNLKGYLLTIVTLGIYGFWWQKDLFAYYVDNLTLEQGDRSIKMKSLATGGGFFKLLIVNLLIIIFTLGLGAPWVLTRTMSFITQNIQLVGNVDLEAITQSEAAYKDATGEDVGDFLDIDFLI